MGWELKGRLGAILYANRFVIVGNFSDVRTKGIKCKGETLIRNGQGLWRIGRKGEPEGKREIWKIGVGGNPTFTVEMIIISLRTHKIRER